MLYFIISAVIVVLDRLSKIWTVSHIALHERLALLPGLFGLTYVQNTGAAFSSFEGMRWVLAAVQLVLSAAIAVYTVKSHVGKPGKLACGAVLGGAVGNLIDRVMNGYVVDMIETQFFDFPVFNIADCFVVIGVIFFFIYYLFIMKEQDAPPKMREHKRLAKKCGPTPDALPAGNDREGFEEPEDGYDGRNP